jgi:hypothetical protein
VPSHLGQGPTDEVCTLTQTLNFTLTLQVNHEYTTHSIPKAG